MTYEITALDREQYLTRPPRIDTSAHLGPSSRYAALQRHKALWAGEYEHDDQLPFDQTTEAAS